MSRHASKSEVRASRAAALKEVQRARAAFERAASRRDAAIQDAIDAGCSERNIGRAAGISGVAVHYRKHSRPRIAASLEADDACAAMVVASKGTGRSDG